MQCDNCQAETAVLLVSNTSNGDSIAVGANCVPTWAVTTAAAATTPEELVSIVFELLGIDPDTHDGAETAGGDTPAVDQADDAAELVDDPAPGTETPLGVVTDPLAEPDTATVPGTESLLSPAPTGATD